MTTDTAPALRLYDSAARAVVPLAPTVTPGTVAIYLCGATVQGSPHIGHMRSGIAFDVLRLLDAGHAYVGEAGNVYFDVRSLPDYGSLTNQWVDDLATTEDESQLDEDVEADKRDPRDFALWKKAKPGEPADAAWDTPWGRGRPGWHLECSAMSRRYLGESFDIHGGGIDLRFPHHENEQAQSHGAGWGFARRWVHNAWVTVKGEKMSKSLGNSLVVAELLKSYDPAVLRLALGTVHYRSTVEFSEETLDSAAALWERLAGAVTRAAEVSDDVDAPGEQLRERALPAEYVAAMDDDLNLAGAMAVVHATLKRLNTALAASAVDATEVGEAALDLRAELDVMGLDPLAEPWRSRVLGAGAAGGSDAAMSALDHLVTALIEDRAAARAAKDWARADALRDQLTAAGVVVEDGADGARWHLA